MCGPYPCPRDASEGKEPQRRLGRRLEEVAEAVGGGYCRLQMPLTLALGVGGTVAGHRLGALNGGGGCLPPFQTTPPPLQVRPLRVTASANRVPFMRPPPAPLYTGHTP